MREFFQILFAAIGSSLLGAIFGWGIGHFAPEFMVLLAKPFEIQSPQPVAAALGAICGLGLGAIAMSVGVLAAAFKTRYSDRRTS
jgi:hypothetical protein